MMETKFRAWDEKRKHMAYQGTPDLETIQSFFHHWGDEKYLLMQSTGLKDSKGVEIFEGDVVRVSNLGLPYQVVYDPEGACWSGKRSRKANGVDFPAREDGSVWSAIPFFDSKRLIKIIGNIHESPELISTPTPTERTRR